MNNIKRNSVVTDATRRSGVVEKIIGLTAVVSWTVPAKGLGNVELIYTHEVLSDLELVAA
jgi:hypothetical protein